MSSAPALYARVGTEGKASAKNRVALLLEDLDFGGTQRQALELARNLDPSRFSPELWLMRAGYDLLPAARDYALRTIPLTRTRRVGPNSLMGLWRRLHTDPVDLLVLLTVIPNIWGRLLGRLARVPVIVATCRGGGSPHRQHERYLWPLADHLLVNASAIKSQLVDHDRLPEHRITVIPNGVDTTFFRPRCDDVGSRKPILLCIARLAPDKDHATLLHAFGMLVRKIPNVELWVVGNGEMEATLKQRAARTLPKGSVRFLPGRLDVRDLLQQATLFVLSSRLEALPNVVLEAMACGLPIVATAVGGLPEVVQHGRTGLLAPRGDAAELARAMETLLLDEALRTSFGRSGRLRAETDYSIAAMVRRHEEVFIQLLERRR